jgi:hypothetical protein
MVGVKLRWWSRWVSGVSTGRAAIVVVAAHRILHGVCTVIWVPSVWWFAYVARGKLWPPSSQYWMLSALVESFHSLKPCARRCRDTCLKLGITTSCS